VATYSTGITATFGSTTFTEVTDLAWTYGGALPKGRSTPWTDDVGSVSLTCLGTAGVTTTNYGVRNDLTITGGGANLTSKAVYEGLSVAPELNGVTRYTVTFKILDG
jgi:hypothetical protein